jgi:type II secretory pathway predicted ATPase ExeA
MYNAHFRFRESPFGVTPDPQFYYSNTVYQEAWATLGYGIEARKGFILLTGEAGTGKTTLLKKSMSAFDSRIKTAYVPCTPFNHTELLPLILTDLGLPACNGRPALGQFTDYLIEQFRTGNIVVLLIDEAQNLSLDTLEELRCLGNLETAKDKLVQIVLAGHVELEQKLEQPELCQLKQRVVLRSRLKPVADSEVRLYMDSRLQVIGHSTEKLFDPAAIEKIALYSTGIPRLINSICDNALLIAYALSERKVSAAMIDEAAEELCLVSSFRQDGQPSGLVKPLEEHEPVSSEPEFLKDAQHCPSAIYQKPKDDPLFDDWLMRDDAGTLSATVNRRETPNGRKAFINHQWFSPTIGAFLSIVLLSGIGIFLYPREWTFRLLDFYTNNEGSRAIGGKIVKPIAFVPSAPAPNQATPALIKEEPINVLMAAVNPSKAMGSGAVQPGKLENKEQTTKRTNVAVTDNSFVRSSPTSNAKIITTLRPGTRIQVTGRMGEYYRIRSLDTNGIRGYIHKEDAFFGTAR